MIRWQFAVLDELEVSVFGDLIDRFKVTDAALGVAGFEPHIKALVCGLKLAMGVAKGALKIDQAALREHPGGLGEEARGGLPGFNMDDVGGDDDLGAIQRG